jgi:hypothetical protein
LYCLTVNFIFLLAFAIKDFFATLIPPRLYLGNHRYFLHLIPINGIRADVLTNF